jgi:hypothetical protein
MIEEAQSKAIGGDRCDSGDCDGGKLCGHRSES